MSKIIVICNSKGGVGKTTLSINLAHSCKNYARTALMDLDTQGSVHDMSEHFYQKPKIENSGTSEEEDEDFEEFTLLPYSQELIESSFKTEGDFDLIIVDTPPYLIQGLEKLFAKAHLIIIPIKAGPLDTAATRRTVSVVKAAKKINPKLKTSFVMNMVKSPLLLQQALDALVVYDLPIFKSRIAERPDLVRSVALEHGIYSIENNKGAQKEFDAFTKEILSTLSK